MDDGGTNLYVVIDAEPVPVNEAAMWERDLPAMIAYGGYGLSTRDQVDRFEVWLDGTLGSANILSCSRSVDGDDIGVDFTVTDECRAAYPVATEDAEPVNEPEPTEETPVFRRLLANSIEEGGFTIDKDQTDVVERFGTWLKATLGRKNLLSYSRRVDGDGIIVAFTVSEACKAAYPRR